MNVRVLKGLAGKRKGQSPGLAGGGLGGSRKVKPERWKSGDGALRDKSTKAKEEKRKESRLHVGNHFAVAKTDKKRGRLAGGTREEGKKDS